MDIELIKQKIKKLDDMVIDLIKNNDHINKRNIIKELEKNGIIEKIRWSIYKIQGIDVLIRFSDIKKSRANVVMALRKIVWYGKSNFFISYQIWKDNTEIQSMNLSFIKKVSHSSRKLTKHRIIGSIVIPNIKKIIDNVENNKTNILNGKIIQIWKDKFSKSSDNEYIDKIIEESHKIKWTTRKKINISNDIIDKIIKDNILIEQKINKTKIYEQYLDGKIEKIKEIFDKELWAKDLWTEMESLLLSKETDNKFADDSININIDWEDTKVLINLKASMFTQEHNMSVPNMFNINKFEEEIINTYNQNKRFCYYFLFVYQNQWIINYKLVNLFDTTLVDNYIIDERHGWKWENAKWSIQIRSFTSALIEKANWEINEQKIKDFMLTINNITNEQDCI